MRAANFFTLHLFLHLSSAPRVYIHGSSTVSLPNAGENCQCEQVINFLCARKEQARTRWNIVTTHRFGSNFEGRLDVLWRGHVQSSVVAASELNKAPYGS